MRKHQERDVEHHDHPEHSYTEYSTITPAGSDIEHPLDTLPFLQRPGGRVPMCLSDRVRIRLDLLRSHDGRIRGLKEDNQLVNRLLNQPRNAVPDSRSNLNRRGPSPVTPPTMN